MMAPETRHTERIGVGLVQIAVERLGQIFREQNAHDYGIDAHMELTENGKATGRLLGLQIKTGDSYFQDTIGADFIFRGDDSHLDYWLNHSLPILMVICNPKTNNIYWQVISNTTVQKTKKAWKIRIPKNRSIDQSSMLQLNELATPIVPADRYTELSFSDHSHATVKRYTLELLLNGHFTKPEIAAVARQVIEEVRTRTYYRNEMVKAHWGKSPAHDVGLYIYLSMRDKHDANWICHASWVNAEIVRNPETGLYDGEDVGKGVIIKWNKNYQKMQALLSRHACAKDQYLAELDALRMEIVALVENAIKLTQDHYRSMPSSGAYIKAMHDLYPNADRIYNAADKMGYPPTQCQDVDTRFQRLVFDVYDIFYPFSERGLKTYSGQYRTRVVKDAIRSYQENASRLGFELEKVR